MVKKYLFTVLTITDKRYYTLDIYCAPSYVQEIIDFIDNYSICRVKQVRESIYENPNASKDIHVNNTNITAMVRFEYKGRMVRPTIFFPQIDKTKTDLLLSKISLWTEGGEIKSALREL